MAGHKTNINCVIHPVCYGWMFHRNHLFRIKIMCFIIWWDSSVDIGSILVVLKGEIELFHKTLGWANTAVIHCVNMHFSKQCTWPTGHFHVLYIHVVSAAKSAGHLSVSTSSYLLDNLAPSCYMYIKIRHIFSAQPMRW